jgi:hypothetical protein
MSTRPSKKNHRPRRTKPPVIGGWSTKNCWSSPKQIELRKREALALQLRSQGLNYARIGEQMKLSPTRVNRMVLTAMDRLVPIEDAERVRVLELARLDELQAGIWEAAAGGDLAAIQTYLKVADQRGRLLGLYPRRWSDRAGRHQQGRREYCDRVRLSDRPGRADRAATHRRCLA